MPAESVKYLNDKGALSRIKELDFNAKFGYKVEIVKGRERDKSYFFNNEGKTIERPKKMDKEKYFQRDHISQTTSINTEQLFPV